MAGVEAGKIVPNTEEKTTTETPTHTDGSASAVEAKIKDEQAAKIEKEAEKAPVKEEKPTETPAAAVEAKDVKPAEEEKEKPADVKTA